MHFFTPKIAFPRSWLHRNDSDSDSGVATTLVPVYHGHEPITDLEIGPWWAASRFIEYSFIIKIPHRVLWIFKQSDCIKIASNVGVKPMPASKPMNLVLRNLVMWHINFSSKILKDSFERLYNFSEILFFLINKQISLFFCKKRSTYFHNSFDKKLKAIWLK